MRPSEIDYSRDVDLRMYAMIRAGWLAGSEVRQVGIPELLGVGAGFVKLSSVRSWQERGTRIVFNESPLRTESLRTMVRRSGALSIVSDWCSRVAVGPF